MLIERLAEESTHEGQALEDRIIHHPPDEAHSSASPAVAVNADQLSVANEAAVNGMELRNGDCGNDAQDTSGVMHSVEIGRDLHAESNDHILDEEVLEGSEPVSGKKPIKEKPEKPEKPRRNRACTCGSGKKV